jgi:hypothetical protein
MSKKISWKTVLFYSSAILFGILIGPFVSDLAGWLRTATIQPGVAQAKTAPVAALAPDSPDAVYVCTPNYVGVFSTRVHVLCTVAAPGGIIYFAAPTSDSKNAARILSVILTAKALGKNLQIYYDTAGDGSTFGCQTSNCRPINAIEIMT